MNDKFRKSVESPAFRLELTTRQIDFLMIAAGLKPDNSVSLLHGVRASLSAMGLVCETRMQSAPKLTQAGHQVANLLKVAGY